MEPLGQYGHGVAGLALDPSSGALTAALISGEILVLEGKSAGEMEEPEVLVDTEGRPNGIAFDSTGRLFIADLSHKAILTFADGESITNMVDNYEGMPFLGPNSLCLRSDGTIFFTDSGPLGTTTLERPSGSVYAITGSDRILVPILRSCLAHPSGICLSADEKVVYVAETVRNQIIRLVCSSSHVFHASVFYRFQGGFGPIALSTDRTGNLFVAHADLPDGGRLSVLTPDGQLISSIAIDRITSVLSPSDKQPFVYVSADTSIYKAPRDHFLH